MSAKDTRIATARREKAAPTIEQIKHAIQSMPDHADIERRNRALIAFTLLTGARDVSTKFSKTFITYFFPVGDDIRLIVVNWVNYLKEQKLWSNDDLLFPMTEAGINAHKQFGVIGLKRKHWRTTAPVREIFREAFKKA